MQRKLQAGSVSIRVSEADDTHEYFVDDELAEAVNIALYLRRPLVLTGNAGTGKTELAHAISVQLGLGPPLEFQCKSDSVGRDLLYRVDNVRRLADAYAAGAGGDARLKPIEEYIQLSALGLAFRAEAQRVVLIDEIDKAPPDFPNDLLDELDRQRMRIPEIAPDHQESARHPPIVIITSNRERELSRPFLRRCIFHYIEYPTHEQLQKIVRSRLKGAKLSSSFISLAVSRFEELRKVPQLIKAPATGELIMWTSVLVGLGIDEKKLKELRTLAELPAIQALIKHRDDLELARGVAAADVGSQSD